MKTSRGGWIGRMVAMALLAWGAGQTANGAGIIYVTESGTPEPPYSDWATAATNIQTAVDYASTNLALYNTVIVSNGTYGIGSEILITNAVTVRSVNGPAVTEVRRTSGTTRVFRLSHAGAVLDGFTIRNGSNNANGGGVYMDAGTLRNSVITNCTTSSGQGGGIYMVSGLVENCVIANNWLGWGNGGGIAMVGGMVQDSIITKNRTSDSGADMGGGGILVNGGNCYIRNCLIQGNTAANGSSGRGGGIRRQAGTAWIENCTIVGNYANGNGAGGVDSDAASSLMLTNSIVYFNDRNKPGDDNVRNVTAGYSCAPSLSGSGNIADDPQFVAAGSGYGTNHVAGNYRLQAASYCIDAGTNLVWTDAADAKDLEGNPRKVGVSVDMGAYETADPATLPLACNFRASTNSGVESVAVTFTARVGGNTNGLGYAWAFGDGNTASGPDKGVVTNVYGPGLYTVQLVVTNLAEQATNTQAALIRVMTYATTYVATNGLAIPPYTDWGTAATDLQEAINQGLGLVLVSNGTYGITAEIVISRSNTVRSVNGPAVTEVSRTGAGQSRIFNISHADAVLDGFTIRNGYLDPGNGGGVYLTAGTVRNCVITNCVAREWGGGIYMVSGLVENCVIANNRLIFGAAGGIYMAGGMIRDSTLSRNRTSDSGGSGGGGGIYVASGSCTVRNCLILGNSAPSGPGGGIRRAGGSVSVENCTIVGNYAGGSGGGGVHSVTLTNSIVYFNRRGTEGDDDVSGGTAAHSCSPSLSGSGNTALPPSFVDDGSDFGLSLIPGNYRLLPASPCIDTGTNLTWTDAADAKDIEGNPRKVGVSVDMGAYEYNTNLGPLSCDFSASTNRGSESATVVFAASVAGSNTTGIAYYWDFGDGTTLSGTDRATVTNVYGPGLFTIALAATNAAGEGASAVKTGLLRVTTAATVYCATNGTHTAPYTSWTTAATNIHEAVSQGDALILVSNGVYGISDTIILSNSNTLMSVNGPSNTVIQRVSGTIRVFTITHPDAVLDGFTIRNGNPGSEPGGGVYMTAGTVRNCIFTNNVSGGGGGGLRMTGGLVSGCGFYGNNAGWNQGGGAVVSGGILENSVFRGNWTSQHSGGGLLVSGSGTIRNCLVAGNWTTQPLVSSYGGGIEMNGTGAVVENCTVVGNRTPDIAAGGGIYGNVSGATIRNCIVYSNSAMAGRMDLSQWAQSNAVYSSSPDLSSGAGNLTNDPQFVANGSGYGAALVPGNYRLLRDSPCIDAGTNLLWMANATDLDGEIRVLGRAPDMGAFEYVPPAGTLILLR